MTFFINGAGTLYSKNMKISLFRLLVVIAFDVSAFVSLCLRTPMPKGRPVSLIVATGYAGMMGCMAKSIHGGTLLISEHGIYSREREEDIIKANWVQGIYKSVWIEHFKKLSLCAYQNANKVTALLNTHAAYSLNWDVPKKKLWLFQMGLMVPVFENIPERPRKTKHSLISVPYSVLLRSKMSKTLLNAFYYAKQRESQA